MGDEHDNIMEPPRWEFMAESPTLESNIVHVIAKYKIKLRYGGYFRLAKNSSRRRYCFGYKKCIYIDTQIYNFDDLFQEVTNRYPSNRDLVFSIYFLDKYATEQLFIKLDSDEVYHSMLSMYNAEKESTVYVTTSKNLETSANNQRCQDEVLQHDSQDEVNDEDESEYSLSDTSYHSRYKSDSEDELHNSHEATYSKKSPTIKVNSTFDNVIEFRRTLIHYAIVNEFSYFLEKSEPTRVTAVCTDEECKWRIHAAVDQDGITFKVRTFVETHSCIRSNKGGNKLVNQGWIASVVKDKLRSDGDVSPIELRKWIMKNYNVDASYYKVFRGKEQAYTDMYGKWEDSFMKMNDFKEELLRRNPGSVVDIDFDKRSMIRKWKGTLVPNTKSYLNRISKNLGQYEVSRSSENRAEVKRSEKGWEVVLDERTCTCRVWQVKGVPCLHAAAFIAFTRDANWDKFVDSYFTIEKFKSAYALDVAPMPTKDEWVNTGTEKIYPPNIKRPPRRPRKNRIRANDEQKRRHKCGRCGEDGHHEKKCKNSASQHQPSTSKKAREKSTQARQNN